MVTARSGSSVSFARSSRAVVVDVGGRFMTSPEMGEMGQSLHLPAEVLYFRSRVGALGDVVAEAAWSVLAIFPRPVVAMVWEQTSEIPPPAAVAAYERACHEWGRRHLGGVPDLARLAELAERLIDGADTSALPLASAWIDRLRPDDRSARAAHVLNLLRELRGGLHFCALRSECLDVAVAVLADPGGGVPRLRRTAWQEPWIRDVEQRAAAVPDLAQRWARAEEATDSAFAACAGRLSEGERSELLGLLTVVAEHTG